MQRVPNPNRKCDYMRCSGILMHLSSLPSPYGIGTMGKAAYEYADFLHEAGQHYWQILPIGPTSYGDSPYQAFSTCAGNPYFIDLDLLIEDGLLDQETVDAVDWENHSKRVDYGFQFYHRYNILYQAYLRGRDRYAQEVEAFRMENPWVQDYAFFMAMKRSRNMEAWSTWPEEVRLRRPGAVDTYSIALSEDIRFFVFLQFLFYRQWNALRNYVHSKGIEIIGDLPIYVPYDSCDVWANPHLFQLDETGTPTGVAGCPPDYFAVDGQLWGNPLYNWERMAQDGYQWWKERIVAASKLFDVIRIDHFRGLESYWSVPYGDPTARNGRWVKGPGHHFIWAMKEAFPHLRLIAEDLGFLTPEVIQLQHDSGFPGMKVLEFAFDSREPGNYLPHRYDTNCICYTGTHDNETLAQWLAHASEPVVEYAMEYLGSKRREDCHWDLIRAGMASVADTFIAQMQDYLELGDGCRMNTPSTLSTENWSWRMEKGAATHELAQKIRKMCELYER